MRFALRLVLVSVLAASAPLAAGPAQARGGAIAKRKDVKHLPTPLKQRLVEIAKRPQSYPPLTVFAEADDPSQLFQYYLLDSTGFEPNVFVAILPGQNDEVVPSVTGA